MELDKLRERFPSDAISIQKDGGQQVISVKKGKVFEFLKFLKEDPDFAFDYFVDICGIDYFEQNPRFAVVYSLYSTTKNSYIRVKVFVPEEDLCVDSAVTLWSGANWAEREVYDMFGIIFNGHPGISRILLPEGFKGYPLRKDFPLAGLGERDNFPEVLG
jgi:NADH-quinone oxidoreductase subunit C